MGPSNKDIIKNPEKFRNQILSNWSGMISRVAANKQDSEVQTDQIDDIIPLKELSYKKAKAKNFGQQFPIIKSVSKLVLNRNQDKNKNAFLFTNSNLINKKKLNLRKLNIEPQGPRDHHLLSPYLSPIENENIIEIEMQKVY